MTDTALFNAAILSKLSWMSRQLRQFDDLNVLIPWVNTMHSIKLLLLPQAQPLYSCTKSSSHKATSCSPWNSFVKKDAKHLSGLPNPKRTIQKQIRTPAKTTLQIKKRDILRSDQHSELPPEFKQHPLQWTNSSSGCRSPLVTSTPELIQLSATKTPSSPVPEKGYASAPIEPPFHRTFAPTLQRSRHFQHNFASNVSTSRKSPRPGMYFWQVVSPLNPKQITWSFHKCEGGEEYKILKETADPNYNFIVQDLRTGKEFDMHLTEDNRIKS